MTIGVRKTRLFGLAVWTGMTIVAANAQTVQAPAGQTPVAGQSLVRPGNIVVTGFSGTRLSDKLIDPSKANADAVTIETNGASLRVLDVSGTLRAGTDPATNATEVAAINARAIGQVFGVTLDDAIDPVSKSPAPNIYTTATSAYGLNIVLPPESENAWPRRTLGGDQLASWMAGQWGYGTASDNKPVNGGPGSIWRIDGITGQVTLFSTIMTDGKPTGAPALGNIAYDARSHQFFVSDLESGLIHRLSLTGQDLGTFDHGVTARQGVHLAPVPDDPTTRADIKSIQFRADDPNTWGYAAPSRRVWGLNVSSGRLYYAVADGPEIWSVSIKSDGNFGDARREIIVPADQGPFEISDISFDSKGWIYLAQRPPVTGNYDYQFLAAASPARLLRYRPDPATNAWIDVPDEFLVGLNADRRQTDGGVALGYGYTTEGKIDFGACDGTLWATGDDLDRSARKTANAGASDAPDGATGLNISGLQASPLDPADLTAKTLHFSDYDGILPRAATRGHVGDVRAFKTCGSPAASATAVAVESPPDVFDLQVEKIAVGDCRRDGICRIEIRIWNRGDRRYSGPLTIAENLDKAGARLIGTGPSRWNCGQGGADISCHHPGLDIRPGLSASLFLDYRLPARWSYPEFADCAEIAWLGDLNSPQTIVATEIELARLGLYSGAPDRTFGPKLAAAIDTYSERHGLRKTGQMIGELIESLFGQGSAIPPDRARPHERSCARFHIDLPATVDTYVPPPPVIDYLDPPVITTTIIDTTCPVGYWNRLGDCVRTCPWGYRAYGDRCFPEGGPICRGGWLAGGECRCPAGYIGQRTGQGSVICQPQVGGPPPSCFGGYQDGGRCLCPAGTVPVNGPSGILRCERLNVQCFGGSMAYGRCACPPNSALRNGRCEPVGRPIPVGIPHPVTCPPGFVFNGAACAPANRRPLPPVVSVPQHPGGNPPPVIAVHCPPGTVRAGNICEPVRRDVVRPRNVPIRNPQVAAPNRVQQVRPVQHVVQRPANVPGRAPAKPVLPNCRLVNGKCVK